MKVIVALLPLLYCTGVVADQFYVTTGLNCDVKKSELVVWFRSAWNEAGENAISNLGPNDIDPRRLVSFAQDESGRYKIDTKTESRTCRIGKTEYVVEFSPMLAPRFHPEGQCAARIGAAVTVRAAGLVVAASGVDACNETGMVTTKILLRGGQRAMHQQTSATDFYGG